MQTPPPSNSLKRRHFDQHPSELEGEVCQSVSKKRKTVHTPETQQPAAHQDNLSQIPLERQALRELQRTITQAARASRPNQRIRRPATRLAVAEAKRRHPPLKPAHIFLENCEHEQYKALKSFAKGGGPDLRNLRGCQRAAYRSNSPMSFNQARSTSRSRGRRSNTTKPTTETNTNKSISPYDRSFQQILIDNRVYPPAYEYPDGRVAPKPGNWEDIKQRLARPRPSLSPSKFADEQHEKFIRADASAAKENQVKKKVIPIIEGEIKDPRTSSGEIPFTNLAPLMDENLVPGNPDFYHGARTEQLERRIRDELGNLIMPSTQHDLPILPNHFTAAKGPDGSAAVAARQASYNAFFGARGYQVLHTFGEEEPQFDGNAYTFSSIYHSGTLKMYTSHPTKPANPGGRPEYYLNHIRSFAMGDTPETWRTGATWYRNSIDMAKEMRDDAIGRANDVANRIPVAAAAVPSASVTSFISNPAKESQLELDTLTVDSQVEIAQSVTSQNFQTAASSQDEEEGEDEPRPSLPLPVKRSGRPHRETHSRRKRHNHEDVEGTGSTSVSSQGTAPQILSAHQQTKRGGKGKKKPVY